MLAALLLGQALAGPERVLVLAPGDAATLFAAEAQAQGRSGPAAEALCTLVSAQLSLCAALQEGEKRRILSRAELPPGQTAEQLWTELAQAARARAAGPWPPTAVPDMPGQFYARAEGDGWDGALLLVPDRAAEIAGGPALIAAPDRHALLIWKAGDPDLDKVMAVAARRMFDASPEPVSPLVYRWSGSAWVVWGQARGKDEPGRP